MTQPSIRARLHAATGRAAVRDLTERVERLEPAVVEDHALITALAPRVADLEQAVAGVLEAVLARPAGEES